MLVSARTQHPGCLAAACTAVQPRIVLLDVGIVTCLSEVDQHNMLNLFRSLSGLDGQGIAHAVLQFLGQPPETGSVMLCAHLVGNLGMSG